MGRRLTSLLGGLLPIPSSLLLTTGAVGRPTSSSAVPGYVDLRSHVARPSLIPTGTRPASSRPQRGPLEKSLEKSAPVAVPPGMLQKVRYAGLLSRSKAR